MFCSEAEQLALMLYTKALNVRPLAVGMVFVGIFGANRLMISSVGNASD